MRDGIGLGTRGDNWALDHETEDAEKPGEAESQKNRRESH